MDSASPRWTRAQTLALAVGCLLTLAGILGTRLAEGASVAHFDSLHWTSAHAAAALIAYFGWRAADANVRTERAWFAATLGLYTIGQFAWDIQVAVGWNPFPAPSDALYVLLGPGMFLGLWMRTRSLPLVERRSLVLCMTGVMAAILAYVLVLYLPRHGQRDLWTSGLLGLYPTMTLGATALCFVLVFEQQLKITWSLALFIGSLGLTGVLWMEWNSRALDGTLVDAAPINYVFSLAALALGVGAALWRPERSTNPSYQRACFFLARSVPFALVLGAALAIMLSQRIPEVAAGAVLACVGVVIVAAAGHQALLLGERERMLRAEARAREIENRSAHSHRLESLGTLAGGIAHDFNNILMAVHGHAQLLDAHTPHQGAAREALTNILSGCERARSVSRSVLSFARHEALPRRSVELREVVAETLRLLRPALAAGLDLRLEAPDEDYWIEADSEQLQRAILNLVANSADAIGGQTGTIRISLSRRSIAAGECGALAAGAYVECCVEDSGCGMDDATQRRAFEPFFTTKGVDRGTGLGLSVVHGIVRAHAGAIRIESKPRAGTRVVLTLPALIRDTVRSYVLPTVKRSEVESSGGGAEILIVDDERLIAPLLGSLAQQLGWAPTIELDPARALAWVESEPERFAVVITDLAMPGMSGHDLARAIHRCAPGLPVVLSSGDAGACADPSLFAGILHKPYGLSQLASMLASLHQSARSQGQRNVVKAARG